ncbi:MAG: WG repeat-containing protein [Clostridia bacterium]|nr:WG repeat-containing protein [Clostridia bacterium]
MKRMFVLMILLNLLFVLVSCNSLNNVDTSVIETENINIIEESENLVGDLEDDNTAADDCETEEIFIPEPRSVSGTYNGKNITMEYYTITNYKVDGSHLGEVNSGYTCAVLSHDEKYGFAFVDPEGNILNNEFYDFSYGFSSDGFAKVRLQDDSWHYIDTNGNDMGLAESDLGNKNVASTSDWFYEENGNYGLLDENGIKVTEPIFDSYRNYPESGDYVFVYYFKNGNLTDGYANRNGKIIEFPESSRISMIVGDRVYIKTQGDGMWSVLDLNGDRVLPKKYHDLEICDDKYYAVIEDGKLGLIDFDGNEIIPPTLTCDWAENMNIGYSEGYLTVAKDGCLAFVKITEQSN